MSVVRLPVEHNTKVARADDAGVSPSETETDVLYKVVANARRRRLLGCLAERDAPMALPELATIIASRRRDTDSASVSPPMVERVHVSLYHVHVPMLVDAGVLRYDEETERVRLTEAGADLLTDPPFASL